MKKALVFNFMSTLPSYAYATDISGTTTERRGKGAQGATVTVSCGELNKMVTTAISGNYRIRNVPDESTCSLSIKYRRVISEPSQFNTMSGRITFSRRVKPYNGRLEFL